MQELNFELTRNQRKENARFHTQNNFFTKEDRDKILDRSLDSRDFNSNINNSFDGGGGLGGSARITKKKKNVIYSVEGEPVDFSQGSRPDLRKEKIPQSGNKL